MFIVAQNDSMRIFSHFRQGEDARYGWHGVNIGQVSGSLFLEPARAQISQLEVGRFARAHVKAEEQKMQTSRKLEFFTELIFGRKRRHGIPDR